MSDTWTDWSDETPEKGVHGPPHSVKRQNLWIRPLILWFGIVLIVVVVAYGDTIWANPIVNEFMHQLQREIRHGN